MTIRFKFVTVVMVALLSCRVLLADTEDIEPKIPPGYTPEDAGTELAIWMELEEYERKIQESALLVKDTSLNEYVRSVACRVAGPYCGDFRLYIVRDPGFNASMTANGAMVIWTGLLVRLSSEDELAAVLGHELAHYTQLHTLDRFRRIKKTMAAGSVLDLGLILLTGANVPAGQLIAAANAMSFSRAQEEEADLLGTKFMARSSYDPRAAARVWRVVVEEEENAAVKRRKPGIFSKTHPDAEDRIEALDEYIKDNHSKSGSEQVEWERHVAMLNRYYMLLMEDQLDTNRYGRTETLLRRHRRIGVDQGLVDFFLGEMYRQRNQDGDLGRAKAAYTRSANSDASIAEAYLNLGYIHLKQEEPGRAKTNFSRYLELKPDTDDRAMIEFYLQEEGS